MALFAVGGVLSYASSPDGVSWSAVTVVPGPLAVSSIFALDVREDTLVVFSNPVTLTVRTYTWSGGWVAEQVVPAVPQGTAPVSYQGVDARWNPHSRQIFNGFDVSYRYDFTGNIFGPAVTVRSLINNPDGLTNVGWEEGPLMFYELSGVTGNVTLADQLLYVLGYRDQTLALVPFAFGGASLDLYNFSPAVETVCAMFGEQQWDAVTELNGALTVVYRSGSSLYATRRLSYGQFTGPVPVATSVSGPFVLLQDPATGDLAVVYQTDSNGVHEINLVARRTNWGLPVRIAGGDGTNHTDPVGAHDAADGVVRLLYTTDGVVEYASISIGGPPQAPTPLAPLGVITDLAPTFRSRYNNLNPNDAEAGGEIVLVRQSDGVTLWDSALVPDTTAYAGTTLAYDTTYLWKRRDKDTLSASGAGSFGPFSAPVSFIVRQGGTATILSITHDGLESNTRQTSTTVALLASGVSRHATMTASLAFVREVPQSVGLLQQNARQVGLTVGLTSTRALQAVTSTGLRHTTTRSAASTAQLLGTRSRTATSTARLLDTGLARSTTMSASLTLARSAPMTAELA